MTRSLLVIAGFLFVSQVHAQAAFDWHQLFGTYSFQTCQNNGSPLWDEDPAHQYVVISADPFNTQKVKPNYLAAALFHDPLSEMVPSWEMPDLDQGPVKTYDKTGALQTLHENVTLADGVHSHIEWYYGDDTGSADFELHKTSTNQISYIMNRHDGLSGDSGQESCTLILKANVP